VLQEDEEEELLECLLANVNVEDADSEDKSPDRPVSPLRLEDQSPQQEEEEDNEEGWGTRFYQIT
jgi:hypothetical protein